MSSEHEASTEQASRTNVSGQCEVFAKCERTLKLPPNTETGAPRADAINGNEFEAVGFGVVGAQVNNKLV